MLTEDQIKKINSKCPHDQGIFVQPYGIPDRVKGPVVYCRWESGGISGGTCWEDSDPRSYSQERPKDAMQVLDILLEEVAPTITYLQFKKIDNLIKSNNDSQWEYYGNSTEYVIEYVELSKVLKLIEEFKNG